MIRLLENNYAVAILSTRDPVQISTWWNSKNFPVTAVPVINGSTFWNDTTHIGVFNKKIPAQVYVDDRGLTFNGDTTNLYDTIPLTAIAKAWLYNQLIYEYTCRVHAKGW